MAIACASSAHAATQDWRLDPVHTRVLIAISHDGFSDALGTVSGSTGWLRYDPDDPAQTRLLACVPLDRLDFGNADWNRAVARLLGAAEHPQARFIAVGTADTPAPATPAAASPSTPVMSPAAPTRAPDGPPTRSVSGPLTLNGITQPMTLSVTVNRIGRLPLPPFRQRLGASAHGELQRAAFGVSAWPSLIGATVRVRIEAEAEAAPAPFPDTADLATLEALPCP